MEIFKWVEEIEKIYDDLIEKAKNESLGEITKVQSSQAKIMEEMIYKNQESLNNALTKVSDDVRGKSEEFEVFLKDLCVKIEQYYLENKKGLTDLLFEKIGFDLGELDFNMPASTANGIVYSAAVNFGAVTVGPIRLENVEGYVNQGELDVSLLGMSFLNRLSGYEVRDGLLTLYP